MKELDCEIKRESSCFGFIGTRRFRSCTLLFFVEDAGELSVMDDQQVYFIRTVRGIPISDVTMLSDKAKNKLEISIMHKVRAELEDPGIFFSHEHDLTRRLQDQEATEAPYRWNAAYLSDPAIARHGQFFMNMIRGYVGSALCDDREFRMDLIARKHPGRVGTRYHRRGGDGDGNVANCVETETIFTHLPSGRQASFVQLRGSVPLVWRQDVCLKYTPRIDIVDDATLQQQVFTSHMNEIHKAYGDVACVSLLDVHGSEAKLAATFKETAAANDVPFIEYDFHTECRGMAFHKVQGLIDDLAKTLKAHGMYERASGTAKGKQTGIIRSNCKDCLDRTNVFQTVLCKAVLHDVLTRWKLDIDLDESKFLSQYRVIWSVHGNAISLHYAGTGALKEDFTRTGKRTRTGAVADGRKSLIRYVRGNFLDGGRQDRLDVAVNSDVCPADVGAVADFSYVHQLLGLGLIVALLCIICHVVLAALVGERVARAMVSIVAAGGVWVYAQVLKRWGRAFIQRPMVIRE